MAGQEQRVGETTPSPRCPFFGRHSGFCHICSIRMMQKRLEMVATKSVILPPFSFIWRRLAQIWANERQINENGGSTTRYGEGMWYRVSGGIYQPGPRSLVEMSPYFCAWNMLYRRKFKADNRQLSCQVRFKKQNAKQILCDQRGYWMQLVWLSWIFRGFPVLPWHFRWSNYARVIWYSMHW